MTDIEKIDVEEQGHPRTRVLTDPTLVENAARRVREEEAIKQKLQNVGGSGKADR